MKKQTLAAAIFLSVLNSSMALSAAPKVEEPPFEGYLFAYFEGRGDAKQQEHLRFALSDDGVNWRALNENAPSSLPTPSAKVAVSATRTSCAVKTDAFTS